MNPTRRIFARFAGAAVAPWITPTIHANTGPTRVLVGFPPGGPVDIAARLVCPLLSERLGRAFEVENVPGDSGNAATQRVASASPDGRTLLLCGPVNTINTTLFPGLPFRFDTDLTAVAGLYRVPLVVEVHPRLPIYTAAELVAHARSRPGQLKVGYAGRGTPQHVGIALFMSMSRTDMALVAYPGSAPALEDLLAGRVDVMFDPLPSSIGHILAGRLRALALTGEKRVEMIPAVPLMADTVPGYVAGSWFGLAAPRGTPGEVIGTLNDACNAVLREPAVIRKLDDMGGSAITGTPAAFAEFIQRETQQYARVIKQAKIAAAGVGRFS